MSLSRRTWMSVALAAGAAGAGVSWWRLRPNEVLSEAEAAFWALGFDTPDGQSLTLADWRGQPLLLNFWATWCPPCVEEMPSLNEFQKQLRDSGVVVLAVSVDQNEPAYKKFIERYGLQFEVARDAEANISASFGTYRYPETYVINQRGEVLEKFIGEENWADPRLIERIKKLM